MAIAFDAKSSTEASTSDASLTTTWTHTASGSNRIVLVTVSAFNNSDTATQSVTYGGTAMTLIGKYFPVTNDSGQSVYALMNPPTGAQTISVTTANTFDSTMSYTYAAASYTGVDSWGTVSTTTTASGITHTVPTITTQDCTTYASLYGYNGNTAYIPTGAVTNGNLRVNSLDQSYPRTALADNIGYSAALSMTFNTLSTCQILAVTVALRPVGSPFQGTLQKLTNTVYAQNTKYPSNSFATYQYMNDDSASGASGQTATAGSGGYVRADCGSSRSVGYIVIGYDYLNNLPGGWGTSYTEGVTIQGSQDASTWTTLGTTPTYASTGSTNGLVTIPIWNTYRYIQLINTSSYFALTEFQVWAMPVVTGGFFAMFT